MTFEIDLQPGEKLGLPQALVESIGAGRWILTVRPANRPQTLDPIRSHQGFLNSYSPEDEGLYDADPPR